ncbi:hypothetical protein CDAR_506191 [Caerostris darwini]|uniref:Uncharacterized protein n=1 Tax=Caerostris darwini TaxID=1538125 RepID=A0AAV4TND3_9ARAC|nr:hypothetical protein CDAR_506191 [Caerostris darwini]
MGSQKSNLPQILWSFCLQMTYIDSFFRQFRVFIGGSRDNLVSVLPSLLNRSGTKWRKSQKSSTEEGGRWLSSYLQTIYLGLCSTFPSICFPVTIDLRFVLFFIIVCCRCSGWPALIIIRMGFCGVGGRIDNVRGILFKSFLDVSYRK